MRKIVISTSVAMALFLSNANASGVPTIDVASIAQSVMGYMQTLKDYTEQIKQYEQMVKDTMNMEKQMKELGVDMNDINQILGDATQMIDDMKNIYKDVQNIPEDVMQDVAKIKFACSFLEKNSSFFGISVKNSGNKIKNKINRCILALENGANISKSIGEIADKMDRIADPIERAKYQTNIDNLKNVEKFIKTRNNIEKVNKLLAFEDAFKNVDKTNRYSQAKMKSDLENLAKQSSKANNQKQAQALTNSILLKILENLQIQYELNINYTSAMASNNQINNQNKFKNLTEKDIQKQVVEYKRNDAIFKPEIKQLPKDELGFPKFIYFKG